EIRDTLCRYLGFRAPKTSWQSDYQAAGQRYVADHQDVQLFGILVRDVSPNQEDLRARVSKLSMGCPSRMVIELLSLYLPIGTVSGLGTRAVAARSGGGS